MGSGSTTTLRIRVLAALWCVAVCPLRAQEEPKGQELLEIWTYPSYHLLQVQLTPGRMACHLDASLLRTPDGKPGLLGEYFDFSGGIPLPRTPDAAADLSGEEREELFGQRVERQPRTPESVLALKELAGKPDIVRVDPAADFYWWGSRAKDSDQLHNDFAVRWTGTVGPFPQAVELAVIARNGIRMWLGGKLVVDAWEKRSLSPEPDYAGVVLEPKRVYDLRLEYFKGDGRGMCYLGYRLPEAAAAAVTSAGIRLLNEQGQELQRAALSWEGPSCTRELKVPDLADGTYTVEAAIPGLAQPAVRRFRVKRFPWQGSRMGVTDHIYPPFKPIEVDGREVRVVLRRYRVGGLGLLASVQARGQNDDTAYRELLARPIALVVDGEASLKGTGDFTTVSEQEVVYEGAADHPVVRVRTRTTTEVDGCMKVELTLAPPGFQVPGFSVQEERKAERQETETRLVRRSLGEGGNLKAETLHSLVLEIPLRDEEAPLQHVVRGSRPLRHNLAGATWAGTGKIFQSDQLGDSRWPSTFRPYWWFGSETRGLAWFADNEAGWVMSFDTNTPCQTVHRQDGELLLRVHLVQRPIRLEQPRMIVFGLMASPTKPMPEDWRRAGRRGEKSWSFSMPTFYGMPGRYQARAPINEDYTIFNHVQARRLGAGADPGFVHDLMVRRYDPENLTGFAGRTATGVKRYAGYRDHLSVYFEEFFSTSIMHDEGFVYRSEWSGRPITPPLHPPPFVSPYIYDWGIYTPGHPPSYVDFATWHAAEWLRRGFGLYFDNSMPKRAFMTASTSAFEREDGTVVPSCGIWAHRAYLKRIWVLHQQFYNPRTPQIMMIHMTNTQVLPYHVWNQVNVDLEWKYRVDALFQEKFRHDLLRAESLGLQTGNYPAGLAGCDKASRAWLGLHRDRYERTRRAGLMVHEIKSGFGGQYYPEVIEEAGYGLDDARVFNYWDREPVLRASDPEAKWLLIERQGAALLVLCTWNPEPVDLTLDLDTARLGFTPKQATDAEAGTNPPGRVRAGEENRVPSAPGRPSVSVLDPEASDAPALTLEEAVPPDIGENWQWDASRARLSLPMPGYGVRLVRFGTPPSPGQGAWNR